MSDRENVTLGAVLVRPGEIELREFRIPPIEKGTGILRVELAGICSGTDVKLYRGKLDNPFPLIMGHEIVGVVEEIGSDLAESNGVRAGDRVVLRGAKCGRCKTCLEGNSRFCKYNVGYGVRRAADYQHGLWGGYARHVFLAQGAVLEKVPDEVTPEQALMAGVLANGLHWGSKLGGITVGSSVVVQGVGQQGLAAVMASKFAGAHPVIAVGLPRDEKRLELARSFGADFVLTGEEGDIAEVLRELTGGAMCDVVVEVTGSSRSFLRALDLVRPGGTVVHGSLSGAGASVAVPLDQIVWKQIRVQGVYSKPAEAVGLAMELIKTGQLPIERAVSHRFPLSSASHALELVEQGGDVIKAVLSPEVI